MYNNQNKIAQVDHSSSGLSLIPGVSNRVNLKISDTETARELQRQVVVSKLPKTKLINELLDIVLRSPRVLSELALDDLRLLYEVFETLPVQKIRDLAVKSHRSPDQMFIHLMLKGIAVYESLSETDPD